MRPLSIDVRHETWPLAEAFTISRGSKTAADVVVVSIRDVDTGIAGHGEAVPYARYGETIEAVLADITRIAPAIASGTAAHEVLNPGAALNAIDCAQWDFEAKRSGGSAATRAGVVSLKPVLTAYTLSLGNPEAMAAKARAVAHLPLLKLKLGGAGDEGRMRAVRAARPDAR
ncbi:MAG: dipeptide epimerase, partial [Hyphomicrobium sp.]|nr:dipeptide epimerase [Hyphomicrobium sp.]